MQLCKKLALLATLAYLPVSVTLANSVNLGDNSSASGTDSVAVGVNSKASNTDSTAVGPTASAAGAYATALGQLFNAYGMSSVAIGDLANTTVRAASGADSSYSTAIGYYSSASDMYATAVGANTLANYSNATALGSSAQAIRTNATAIGNGSLAYGDSATVVGNNAKTSAVINGQNWSGLSATAIGDSAIAVKDYATAVGHSVYAAGDSAVAVGNGTQASTNYTTAIGSGETSATTYYSTAIGRNARAKGDSSGRNTAIGYEVTVTSHQSTGIGNGVEASGALSTAIGSSVYAQNQYSTAVGTNVYSQGDGATALGYNVWSKNTASTAIGSTTGAEGYDSTGIGTNTTVKGSYATGIGAYVSADGASSAAMGTYASSSGANSVAIGSGTVSDKGTQQYVNASGTNAVAIGTNALARQTDNTAIGSDSDANAENATAVGARADAYGQNSTAVGNHAYAMGGDSVSIGSISYARDDDTTAIGHYAYAYGTNSTAIGYGARTYDDEDSSVYGKSAVAIGYDAVAAKDDNVAIGANAVAKAGSDSVALGSNSIAESANVVSVGHKAYTKSNGESVEALTRRITNVADGVEATDAATVGQTTKEVTSSDGSISVSSSTNSDGSHTFDLSVSSDGTIAKGNTEVVNGGTVYNEVRPSEDGHYISTASTTGTNLTALDSQVYANAQDVAKKANADASNIKGDTTYTAAWQEALGDGKVKSNNTGLVTGGTVYSALRKESRPDSSGTYNYISSSNTAGKNLAALDEQVGINAADITSLKDLSNISNTGKTVISNLAKSSVKVVKGTNTTVTAGTDGDAITYAVNVSDEAIKNAVSSDIAGKANIDASNITGDNISKWQDVLDTGAVSSGNTGLLNGGAVYTEVRPASDGNYVKTANSTGTNLLALDTQVGKNTASVQNMNTAISNLGNTYAKTDLTNVTEGGKTTIRSLAKESVKVIDGVNTTVTTGSDGQAVTYAVNVSSDTIRQAVSSDLSGKANVDASNLTSANISAWQSSLGNGSVASGNSGLITGDTAYTSLVKETRPDSTKTYNYISSTASAGANLEALDTAVAGKADTSLSDITSEGASKITALAKDAVTVKGGNNVSVTKTENGTQDVYTVSVLGNGTAASGDTELITGDTLYKENRPASDGTYVKTGNTTGTNLSALDTQVKANADAIDTQGKTIATHTTQINNMETTLNGIDTTYARVDASNLSESNVASWQSKLGNGTISSSSTGLVTGKTVYDETRVTGTGYNVISRSNTAASNLEALDTQIGQNTAQITTNTSDISGLKDLSNITESGKTVIRHLASGLTLLTEGDNVSINGQTYLDGTTEWNISATGDGAVAQDNTGLISGGTLYSEVRVPAKTSGVYNAISSDNTTAQNLTALDEALTNKSNTDLDNLTTGGQIVIKNLAKEAVKVVDGTNTTVTEGTDGETTTYAVNISDSDIQNAVSGTYAKIDVSNVEGENVTSWQNKLGTESISSGNNGLVKSGALYSEIHVADGTYNAIAAGNTVAGNLEAIDTALGTKADADLSNMTDTAKTNITNVSRKSVVVKGSEYISVNESGGETDGEAVTYTVSVSPTQIEDAVGSTFARVDASNVTGDYVQQWQSALGTGAISSGDTGLVTGGTVHDYVTPSASGTYTYISTDKTAGENLAALDQQVHQNAADISNLDSRIIGTAVASVSVTDGKNTKVSHTTNETTNAVTYTVDVEGNGSVAQGNEGLISGGSLYSEVRVPEAEEGSSYHAISSTNTTAANLVALDEAAATNAEAITTNQNSITTLSDTVSTLGDTYAKKDASNLTDDNKTAWQTALGTGTVAQDNAGLITGGTLYSEVRPSSDGTYVKTGAAAGENLTALDKAVASNAGNITSNAENITKLTNLSNLTETGKTKVRKLASDAVTLKNGTNTTVSSTVDDTTGKTVYQVNAAGTTSVVSGGTGLVTSGGVYSEVRPETNGNYVKSNQSTGKNLLALDTQVKTNAANITSMNNTVANLDSTYAKRSLGNITDDGRTVIRTIAKKAVVVQGGDNVSVTTSGSNDDSQPIAYTVSVSDSDIKSAVSEDLSGKADVDASNVTDSYLTSWQNKLAADSITAAGNGLVKSSSLYTEVRPVDGTYVRNTNSTAGNLKALDDAVTSQGQELSTVKSTYIDQHLNNISETGKTEVRKIAQNAVTVKAGSSNVTVSGDANTETGVTTYTVSVTDADIQDAVSGTYAKIDASNVEGDDVTSWQNKLGTSTISSGNTGLIKSDALYNEVHVSDGTAIKAGNTVAQNLSALDTNLGNKADTSFSNITEDGRTVIHSIAKSAVKVVDGTNTTVRSDTDGDTATYAVDVSNDAIKAAVSDDLDKKADLDASNVSGVYLTKWQNTLGNGTVESGNTGLVTGGTFYTEVRPAQDGTYIKAGSTTAANLAALDNMVATNNDFIQQAYEAIFTLDEDYTKNDMSNVTNEGKTVIRNLAKESVKVVNGTNTTVTEGQDGEAVTYAVNISDDDIKTAVSTDLASKADLNAANVTGSAVAAWQSVLGTGSVSEGNTGLVTGGTVYASLRNETRPDAANEASYHYIHNTSTAGSNLAALDTQVNTNASSISELNTKVANLTDLAANPVEVVAGNHTTVTTGTNASGATTYAVNVSTAGSVEQGNTGLVTSDTMYSELRPTSNGNYVKTTNTTADNLSALDSGLTDVKNSVTNITADVNNRADRDLSNITDNGKKQIFDVASESVEVTAGNNVTIDRTEVDTSYGKKSAYKVSISDSSIKNIVAEDFAKKDGSNVDSSSAETWAEKIGTGTISSSDGRLVTGKTVYNYVSQFDGDSLVQSDGNTITIASSGTEERVDISGEGGMTRVVTGVATDPGDATSAANVGYVDNRVNYVNRRLTRDINRVGAGAAALAALQPVGYDPDAPWQFSVGMGHYKDRNAAAFGVYYQPGSDVMLSLGGTVGNGDSMYNLGMSFRFGSGSPYAGLSREALIRKVSDQDRELGQLKNQLGTQTSEIQELKQKNQAMEEMNKNMQAQITQLYEMIGQIKA